MDEKIRHRITWSVIWIAVSVPLVLSVILVSCAQSLKADAAQEPDYETQVMDLAWITLTGVQQISLCRQWETSSEDEWRQFLQEAGPSMVSEDAWIAVMERHC